MQNTNFVYHPESLMEMQIMCLLAVFYFTNREDIYSKTIDFGHSSNIIMAALMLEHIFSCAFAFFRSYDIGKNGLIDINGVKRAPTELFIANIQFFIGCIIIGYAMNHFL